MRRRTLLIAGLTALAASLIGPAVQASIAGDTGWWDGHMTGSGHMGWWDGGPSSSAEIEGAAEMVVTANDFAFSPAEITVGVGEPVNLTLVNDGDLPHDLAIPELDVRIAVGPGRQATTGIEVERAGSYQILCTYSGHAEAGMTGLLTVTPNT